MAQEREISVLRKKAEAAKAAPDGAPMTPERAISQALSKVAQEQMDLPLRVADLSEARRSLADLPEMLEDLSLLAVIEGPGEALGLLALPAATLSVLIEMQTMGRLAKTAPAPRKPTRIDAAMAAEFIDAVLAEIEEALIEDSAIAWAGGFRYASHLDDPRPLGLLLEDVTYRVWSGQLAFGAGGEREGGLLWAVPQNGRGASLRRAPPEPQAEGGGRTPVQAAPDWGEALERAVMSAPAELAGVLHRVTLPLSAVMGLRVGTEIPIPEDALERITIEGHGRRRLSRARLGQSRGMRALRLIDQEDEAALDNAPRRNLGNFEVGASPFPESAMPARSPRGLGDPLSAAYDDTEADSAPDLWSGDAGALSEPMPEPRGLDGLQGLGAFEAGPDGLEAADELPPLKMTTGL